jgi:hypothetical protein
MRWERYANPALSPTAYRGWKIEQESQATQWPQIESEARRRGVRRPMPGKDF